MIKIINKQNEVIINLLNLINFIKKIIFELIKLKLFLQNNNILLTDSLKPEFYISIVYN